VRKTSAVLATLSLAVLALTGCSVPSSSSAATCDRDGVSDSILNVADVSGEVGESPDVEVFGPVDVKESAFADAIVGEGRAVSTPFQPLVLDIAFYAGDSGEKIYASEFNGDLSRVHSSDYWVQRSPGLTDVLDCATAGSRIVAVLTPEDFGPQNVEGFGLAKDEDVVAVIDILDVHLARATGALQFNDAKGMPTVVRAADGTPGVIIPDSAAPKKSVTQTLIKGDGAEVKAGDTVFTNVMAVNWDDGTVATNTWGAEASSGAAAQELIGATVGSQLLVVLPGAEGASATAIVVDILGIAPAPAQ
jgi:peptidylprolyl isomerase